MTDISLDAPPADILRFAFTPPTYIVEHVELGPLYTEIVTRMRREAEGLPLDTVQQLLLSKIALGFVLAKYYDEIGWSGTNARKDHEAQQLALMKEWSSVLIANKERVAAKVIEDFKDIVVGVVSGIANDADRKAAQRNLVEKFAERGY